MSGSFAVMQIYSEECKVPSHDGYTCEETRDGNNVDFDVVYERNGWKWKRCPKCKHCIEFFGGSHIVTCRRYSSTIDVVADVELNFATGVDNKYHSRIPSSLSICVA
nr:probable E3 ubiquitin-protein ligase RNF217 [Tanacetum cinerariifolium]